ncbi:MAG: GlmU family protein [Melioribacteraceae bacterium]|nr:GlmU family protein [Melioribacteraceae bacterium]
MKQLICLFENNRYSNLHPLVYLRPVYDLLCGILTLREKAELYFPNAQIILHSRNYLEDLIKVLYPKNKINQSNHDSITFINGRLLINSKIAKIIAHMPNNHAFYNNDEIIAVKTSKATYQKINKNDILDFQNIDSSKEIIDAKLLNYPWELVNLNGEEIKSDFKNLVKKSKINFTSHKSVVIINKKSVFINKGALIGAFTVLDASDGPIYIGKNVEIFPHVIIKGPVYIGDNTIVKSHTSIYQNTSIGKFCKVGGEIVNSIIHSYSNKQHEGFLGHSYLGSWVNIGAGTINSNLKNNYGNIDVHLNGHLVNTESQFVGLIMGDHSKTAINTMFNTGTVVGVSCNIFGPGFPPKYIPSFSWGGSDWLRTYNISKCKEVAKLVMKRRGVELSAVEESLFDKIFELTKNERRN